MAKRFDVCSPRPRKDSDKPYWHRVGTAWDNDKGTMIYFDSLPLPDEKGRVAVALFEAKEKQSENPAPAVRRSPKDEMNDDIPFG